MATSEDRIIQIYEFKTINADTTYTEFVKTRDVLREIRAEKEALSKSKGSILDPVILAQATQRLKELATLEERRVKVLNEQTAAVTKQGEAVAKSAAQTGVVTRAFTELNNQYREAKENAEDLAARFGIESVEAKAAAASAAAYKTELQGIQNLIKTGGRTTGATGSPVVDFSPANNNSGAATEEVIKNAERIRQLEADITSEAAAIVATQKQVNETFVQTGIVFEDVEVPLQKYTGTLRENLKTQTQIQVQTGTVQARIKALDKSYADGNITLNKYLEKKAALLEQERRLNQQSAQLSQTINAQVKYVNAASGSYDQLNAELGLSRDLMRQLSEGEKGTQFGAELQQRITVLDTGLKKTDAGLGNFQRNVGNYAKAAFGYLKTAANILPGIGIAGIFGLLFDQVSKLVDEFTKGNEKIDTFKEKMDGLREITQNANKSIAEQSTTLRILYTAATDANRPIEERKNAVDALQAQFPKYFKNLDDEIILNGKASNIYQQLAKDIVSVARAKAAKDKIDSIEEQRLNALQAKANIDATVDAQIQRTRGTAAPGVVVAGGGAVVLSEAERKKALENARQQAQKKQDDFLKSLDEQERFFLQFVDANDLAKALIPKTEAIKKLQADKLSALDKNALNEIDSRLQTELALENTRYTELKQLHELSFQEEREHVNNIGKTQAVFLEQKIKFLESQKNLNTAELKQLASFKNDRATAALNTSKEIDAINKREFADRVVQLQAQRDEEIRIARSLDAQNQENFNLSPTQRAKSKVDADKAILDAQKLFNDQQNALELELKQHSEKNAKDTAKAVADAYEQLRKDTNASKVAVLEDIRQANDRLVSELKTNLAAARIAILTNDKLTTDQKNRALADLSQAENKTLLSAELAKLNEEIPALKSLYDQGLVDAQKYLDALQKQKEVAAKLEQPDSTQTKTQKFLGINIGDSGITVGDVIKNSFDLAKTAMNDYFNQEAERINESRSAALDRLGVEEDAAKKRATSQAEIEKIDRDYQKKKDQINKEAGEKLKKQRKAELAIAFATEIANIAVAAAANPANAATFGGAGAIQFGILSGFALARNLVQLANINSQQFEFGGNPDLTTTRGGKVKGRKHSAGGNPFVFKGRVFEDEVDELNVIRTKSASPSAKYSLEGTHTQIASALNSLGGGVTFQPGAKVRRLEYGGNLGESLQAPFFVSASSYGNDATLASIQAQANAIAAVSQRIDRLQVVQQTSTVTDAQAKQVIQSSIGTL